MAAEETCSCGQWALAEYGPHCPSCVPRLDMHGVVAIAEAYALGDAITSQIAHLLELWANPGMDDTWGININAVTRIEEKLLPVLRQYAPAAASELEQAINFWKEG